MVVMANPLHQSLTKALLLNRANVMGHPKPYLVRVAFVPVVRLTKALLLNRGDVMGHPKPYLVRVKTVAQLGSSPPNLTLPLL